MRHTKEGILLFLTRLTVLRNLILWYGVFFFFLFFFFAIISLIKQFQMLQKKRLFLLWFFFNNRFACLGCVGHSSEQKPKWGLWKRARRWIVSNKTSSGIYLWWVYILCFLMFRMGFHANSVLLILEFRNEFACLYQGLFYTTD